MPSRRAPPVYAPPAPLFTWTGVYIGGNLGGVVDSRTNYAIAGVLPVNQVPANTYALGPYPAGRQGGFTGGGQIGFNYQIPGGRSLIPGGLVVGIEADAAYTDLDHTQDDPVPAGAGRVFRTRLDFLGTVRGRIGYALDHLLVYGTGGFAYGQTENDVALLNVPNTVARFSGSGSTLQTGYAVGGGIEYAIPTSSPLNVFRSTAVTLRAEYLHYDLGSTVVVANANPAVGAVGAYNTRLSYSGDLVRVGFNFKLGSSAVAPTSELGRLPGLK